MSSKSPGTSTTSPQPVSVAPTSRRRGRFRLGALVVGCVFGVVAAEVGLRLFSKNLSLDSIAAGWGHANRHPQFRSSPTLGYEPIPGVDEYNELGVLKNNYTLARGENLVRILVLGDSVTHRRIWVDGLERRLRGYAGDAGTVELWNAGVEGYNTTQEQIYLREKCLKLGLDMVIVQFHLNDFMPLPVLFQDQSGEVAFLPFDTEHGPIVRPLFDYSYLYRYLVLRWRPTRDARREAARASVKKAVLGIRELCRENQLELVFVIFPLFKPRAEYEDIEQLWHRWILEILREAGIRPIDLHEAFPEDASILRFREKPEDPWHPNEEGHRLAGLKVAERLVRHRLLRSLRRSELEGLPAHR